MTPSYLSFICPQIFTSAPLSHKINLTKYKIVRLFPTANTGYGYKLEIVKNLLNQHNYFLPTSDFSTNFVDERCLKVHTLIFLVGERIFAVPNRTEPLDTVLAYSFSRSTVAIQSVDWRRYKWALNVWEGVLASDLRANSAVWNSHASDSPCFKLLKTFTGINIKFQLHSILCVTVLTGELMVVRRPSCLAHHDVQFLQAFVLDIQKHGVLSASPVGHSNLM